MEDNNTKKHGVNRKILILILILPLFLVIGREIARGQLIAHMRAVDLAKYDFDAFEGLATIL